jgi:hypothetical protein
MRSSTSAVRRTVPHMRDIITPSFSSGESKPKTSVLVNKAWLPHASLLIAPTCGITKTRAGRSQLIKEAHALGRPVTRKPAHACLRVGEVKWNGIMRACRAVEMILYFLRLARTVFFLCCGSCSAAGKRVDPGGLTNFGARAE